MRFIFLSVSVFLIQVVQTQALCVRDEQANLRRGPGVSWNKTWEAIRYMPLKKLGKEKGWYRVEDVDGNIHWVREDLVTHDYSCAVIKTDFSNLRTGPGTQYPKAKVPQADKYVSFRIVKSQGDWIKVEDPEGDELWVTRDNLWIQ